MVESFGEPVELRWAEYKSMREFVSGGIPLEDLEHLERFRIILPRDGREYVGQYLGSEEGHSLFLYRLIALVGP